MTKLVINADYGGFSLSREAVVWMRDHGSEVARSLTVVGEPGFQETLKQLGVEVAGDYDIPRDDALLVAAVEELGERAGGSLSSLKVIEIPDGIDWEIASYDGVETVHEKHRTWS